MACRESQVCAKTASACQTVTSQHFESSQIFFINTQGLTIPLAPNQKPLQLARMGRAKLNQKHNGSIGEM
ncbi:hypothetical protein GCM10011363_42720 [Marivita lacus]|uniref:Uncharacterized protein n=1 Tax=Marivita lacus TaxID=1323742 RepID=A0ABQ1LBY2_9RHOB|nr:hypothetical protein GCM10011363_42720 [Marivita lacus]